MANGLDSECATGGILKLLELKADHPAEFAYDFRSKFGISSEAIGDSVSYLEACYLVAMLMRDPSSWIAAARFGWNYPTSREWIVLQDLYNLTMAANSPKKPKPYPGPWETSKGKTVGKVGNHSQDKILARLEKKNPKESNASE